MHQARSALGVPRARQDPGHYSPSLAGLAQETLCLASALPH